ncbi:hypothetical protein Ciccas_010049 [Cichlidogyrus casuarinus]|uniref:Uncharacterized protein n=1 Tax=Cichlidogyrus casuarinus TaxID=1844966 RepID=A0ABD2PX61_9PLAT
MPLTVFSLTVSTIARLDNIRETLKVLGLFIASSIVFNSVITLILLPIILLMTVRRLSFVPLFLRQMVPAVLTGVIALSS